jgi:trimeric autotransporter adhesin
MRNAAGTAVDFMCANGSTSTFITSPQTIPAAQWSGASIPAPSNLLHGYLRTGSLDNGTAADWTTATPSIGAVNAGLTTPFNGSVSVAMTPTTSGAFSSGIRTLNVAVNQAATQIQLRATSGTSIGNSNAFNATSTVVANAQSASVAHNTATAITLTGQDSANPGATLTYTVASNPANGVLSGAGANRTYTPLTNYSGLDSFTFTVANGAIISAPATVSITVLQPPGEIAIEQPVGTGLTDGVSTVNYGAIPVLAGTARTFTVRNVGATDIAISGITKDGTNSADVTIGTISSSTISAGSTATFDVTFAPGALGLRSAAIHVLSDDLDEGSFDIGIEATGSAAFPDIAVEQPTGTIRPDQSAIIDYGVSLLGTPVTRTFTIRNTGGADLSISGVTIDGLGASQFSAGMPSSLLIAPAGSATLSVTFSPTAPGASLAMLRVLSNDTDEASYGIEMHGIGTIMPGPVTLARDVNAIRAGGAIPNFLVSGTFAYYTYGLSIYRTNGTAAGTTLIGSLQSTANPGLAMAGTILLWAGSDTNGIELWSFNGTTASRLADINVGAASSSPLLLTTVGSLVYFTANNGTNGTELWRSDGTAAGTVLVRDIVSGTGSSSIANLTAVGSTLFFTANDGINGTELWKSDGTTAGTVMVANISAGAGSSSPANLTAIGSNLYFSANNGISGIELYRSDGTTTAIVLDINLGSGNSSPSSLFNWGGTLYFRASTTAAGVELWKSDGTSGGTVQVRDIFNGASGSTPGNFTVFGSSLYFSAVDSTANGVELWKTDGTSVGTVMVSNINATANGSSNPAVLTVAGSSLFFYATEGTNGSELWKTDGTALGTVRVEDINLGIASSGITAMVNLGGIALFGATDGVTGSELWRSDGTSLGTFRVSDAVTGNNSASASGLTALGSALIFAANDGVTGTELWSSDGMSGGTVLLRDIHPTAGFSSAPSSLTLAGSTLYFSANDPTNGTELWKTDGTTGGTVLVANLNAGSASSSPSQLRAMGGTLLFAAMDTTANGQELWKSDGTAGGTVLVKNINPTVNGSSFISSPVVLDSLLYFTATDGTNGAELWVSDGTNAGTVMVKNIHPTAGTGSSINSITAVGSSIFFSATDGVNGQELWKSDGTTAGTVMVKDINPGSANSSPSNLVSYNGVLYFAANDGVALTELWRSDGTTAGTFMLADINPGAPSSSPANFRVHNGVLYFSATDSFGTELWRTDGTVGGTAQVKDIFAGVTSSSPGSLTSIGSHLYFAATGLNIGNELWRTDGTSSGTQLVSDINVGAGSSFPGGLTMAGSRLFFLATVTGTGQELYSYDLGSAPELSLYEGADTSGVERQDNVGTYDFGIQSAATTRNFTIKNTGTGYLYVSNIVTDGPQADSFVVVGRPDPSMPILPGATHTFSIMATLEGPVSQSAIVSVLCNDADESSFDIPVTVTVDDSISPVITAPATYLIGQPGTLAMSLPDLRGIVAYSDNRAGDGTITQSPIPGDIVVSIGEIVTVSFTATDSSGNVSNTVTTQVQMGLGQPNTGHLAWARAAGAIGSEGTISRVAATPDGGVVVSGVFSVSPFTIGSGADQVSLTTAGSTDIFVARFDKDGRMLWARRAGGTNTDSVNAVMTLPDGSVIITGIYSFASLVIEGVTLSNGGGNDTFIARYMPNGSLAWAKGFGGSGGDSVTQMTLLSDGNIAIAGGYGTTSSVTVAPGVTLVNMGAANTDLFLIKYQASDGTALWAKSFGSSATSENNTTIQLAAAPSGGVYLSGGLLSSTFSITGASSPLINVGAANTSDVFVTKFDSAGTLQWAKNVGGGTGAELPISLQVLSNGDAALAGTFASSSTTFGVGSASPQTFTPIGNVDVFLLRLSGGDGSQLWAKRAGGIGGDTVVSMLALPDNSLALTGLYANGAMQLGIGEARQTILTAPTTNAKVYIARFSGGDGTLRWAKTTGGLAGNTVAGFALLGEGDIGLVGTFATPSEVFGPGEANATAFTNLGTGTDVFVAKFTRVDGNLIWAKRGGGANTDSVHAITALPNGSAMVIGTFQPPSATFGLGEAGETTLANIEATGTSTDFFFARFHGGGVEPPVAPLISLLPASDLSPATLTFNASIDSRGQETAVLIEYGPTTSYGTSVPVTDVPAGFGTTTRSLSLTGLPALSTLNFRVVATNAAGTTTSANQAITTYADAEIVVEEPVGTSLTDGASTVDFGAVALGSSAVRTFTVRNTASTGTLSGLVLSKDGVAAAEYTLGPIGSTSLLPGESTTFTVTFTPSLSGTRLAAIQLASNDGDENPFNLAMTGDNFIDVTFTSAADIPITSAGYTVPAGRSLGLALTFAPAAGSKLTVINNTGTSAISGTFVDLPDGNIVTAVFGGLTYLFNANYRGGDGNDLVLTRAYDWTWMKGSNANSPTASYGIQGIDSPANMLGGRSAAMTWSDAQGNLWVFGGFNGLYFSDLWRYSPSTGLWTWMKGSSVSGQNGIYGSQGVENSANNPGARQGGVTWIDSSGRLWLFGGFGLPISGTTNGALNDLWRYNPATNNWTWIKGSATISTNGTYGTQGTPNAANTPGSRVSPTAWTDASDKLWLFGGNGLPATGTTQGSMNDLWRFDPLSNEWTWVKGVNTINSIGTYGTLGTPAAGNTPSTRQSAAGWLDQQGRFWLLGGSGFFQNTAITSQLGDLWRFDPTTNMWTWVNGSALSTANQNGVYGRQGIPAATNAPGFRQSATTWRDMRGRLWLYGGAGRSGIGTSVSSLNDLWFYDTTSNQWTWVKGAQTHLNNGTYGTLGVADVANSPGARSQAASFAINSAVRDVWLFGGSGLPATGTVSGFLNDLWHFELPDQPSVTTLAASSVTDTSATLNASSVANGTAASVRFLVSTAANLAGAVPTSAQSIGAGTTPVAVSLPLTGLLPETTYYVAAEVISDPGSAQGSILNFTTLSIIDAWRLANLGTTSNSGNTADGADFDNDGETNFSEFAFGTNPASNTSGTGGLVTTGGLGGGTLVSRGKPIVVSEPIATGTDYRVVFIRRKDHVASGLNYIPKFSSNMTTWQNSTVTPTVLADDGTYQAVSVTFPRFIAGRKARFFVLTVEVTP